MNMNLSSIKCGLALVMLLLVFGIGLGVAFGVNEDMFKTYVTEGIAAHPEVHDEKSKDKIWRYAQRAHFHATGIAAFSIGLLLLVSVSSLKEAYKKYTAILIGLGGFYPLSWFSMFLLAPSMGRDAAHSHLLTEFCVYLGVGSLSLGLIVLLSSLFLGQFNQPESS